MNEILIKQHVAAPPGTVFQCAADFARAPQRIKNILRVEMLGDGPIGVGTRFKETRMMFGRECTETMEVTAYEPPQRYALGCETCGCRYQFEFHVTPSGDGADMQFSVSSEPVTRMARIMGFVLRPLMNKMLQQCSAETAKDLADLKSAIEQDLRHSAAS